MIDTEYIKRQMKQIQSSFITLFITDFSPYPNKIWPILKPPNG